MSTFELAACVASAKSRLCRKVFIILFVGAFALMCAHSFSKYHHDSDNHMYKKSRETDGKLLSANTETATWKHGEKPLVFSVASTTLHGFLVNAEGDFLQRVHQFNDALAIIRQQIMDQQQTGWNDTILRTGNPPEIIWGARDDYLQLLATSHRHIITVALPWLKPETSKSTDMRDNRSSNWSSLADFSNVLIQNYYSWSADDKLCTLIKTPGAIKMKYDALYNRTCERNISFTAGQPQPLVPVTLNSKPISRNHYWPNNGDSLPSNFYTNPPPYVFYMHVHSDAFVNGLGDVFSGHSALLLYLCRDSSTEPQTTLPADAASRPLYDEVLTVTQHWGTAVFHRMVEVVPRIAVFVEFLKAHPTIKIHAPGSAADRLNELVRMFGLDDRRLVYGTVRAKIVYQPRATGCGTANVQESQVTSKLYRDYIGRTFSGRRNRDRLILIRRSGSRKFTEQSEIERLLKQAAADFGLTYELFPDNPTPSLNETMMMFNAAVMVVAPHGAGLSNILFSEPGTFVIEGACNVPHVNLCFQRLAYVLGHRWHALTSRGGCESVVDVPAIAVDKLVRDLLRVRKESTESH